MRGGAFLPLAAAVALVIAFIAGGFIIALPLLLLLVLGLVGLLFVRRIGGASIAEEAPRGVPSTRDASWNPQEEPHV